MSTHSTPSHNRADILFISMDWYRSKDPKTPLAIASIEAHFRHHYVGNFAAEFTSFDLNSDAFVVTQVTDLIGLHRPQILALGVYIWNEKQVQAVLRYVAAQDWDCQIILGGPQITYGNENLPQEYVGADFFVRGAGETPFVELVGMIEHKWFLPENEMLELGIYTPAMLQPGFTNKIYQADIDKLVSPFLTGVHALEKGQKFVRWETMRGCPYQCSFCQFRIEKGKYAEFNLKRVLAELELFHKMGVQEIAVLDPIFNIRPDHYLPIMERMLELGMTARFSFQVRLELLTRKAGLKFLELCKEYGNVCLEFGVQTFREAESKAVNRGNHYGQIATAIELLNASGLEYDLHLIFGLPFQTLDDFIYSYEQARAAGPSRIFVFPLNVLKGTALAEKASEWGYAWDTQNYNLFSSSRWMNTTEVAAVSTFAQSLNAAAKQLTIGQKPEFPPFHTYAQAS